MRARNIKPSFFTNDILAECEPLSRILFIGLWTLSDREGRLEDRPKKIKAEVLPYDNCDADSLLQQLQDHGFILRYHAAGNKYIQILTFSKHQNPHVKETTSIIPAPDKPGASTVQKLPLTDSPFPLPEPPTVRAPGFFEKCFQLATTHFPNLTPSNTASIHAWQEAGYDFDLHVKPVLDSCKAKGSTPRGFSFFTPAIEDSAKLKVKPVPVKEKPKQLTSEEIEKNREFFKRMGMQHPIYNPEGIRA